MTGSLDRKQEVVGSQYSFPCGQVRHNYYGRPETADRVTPGDVAVVASMGDSVIAGTAAAAQDIAQAARQFRGVAFASGRVVVKR